MKTFFIFFLTFLFFSISEIKTLETKYWLSSCTLYGCEIAINECSNCFGETNCKRCITNIKQYCSFCAEDIFDKEILETIGNEKYFLCDNTDPFQRKICHIYCRGKLINFGDCKRIENIPACECSLASSTTSIATTKPKTTKRPFIGTLTGHTSGVSSLTVLNNGNLASGSVDRTIKIWNTNDFSLVRTLTGHTDIVRTLSVLKNGNLASGSSDRTIKIWNTNDGSLIRTITGFINAVYAISVLNNGNLASGSDDGSIKIWNVIG
ncbi:unnamed protein product [Brachionus calyciflorus]|uniref:Uncharacterized protein n=1 Tax=Brachionus calyciflorus TaxID=104777 RepID=A0A814HSU3_9BILA|nr:unnamed protein product [Brachionus calyciflorus]